MAYERLVDTKRGELGIISCNSGRHFAEKVASQLEDIILKNHNVKYNPRIDSKETIFANTELKTEIQESVRNRDIYIFQDIENKTDGMSVNDNYMALKTAILASKSSAPEHVTAVVPVFPYARQDKPKSREGVTAGLVVSELVSAGAKRVITLDVHQETIAGMFTAIGNDSVLENLRASKRFIDYINGNIPLDDLVIVAPDTGGAQRANFYAKKLELPLNVMYKERDYSSPNNVGNMRLVGDVKDKNCFFIDDMIDTAGTTVKSIENLKELGAKDVYFAASLPLFNGPAIERLSSAYERGILKKVIGTNVVYHGDNFVEENDWFEEIPMERYFAKVIYHINQGRSISKLLE